MAQVSESTKQYREWLLEKLLSFGERPFGTLLTARERELLRRASQSGHVRFDIYDAPTHKFGAYTLTDRARAYIMRYMQNG